MLTRIITNVNAITTIIVINRGLQYLCIPNSTRKRKRNLGGGGGVVVVGGVGVVVGVVVVGGVGVINLFQELMYSNRGSVVVW